MPYTKIKVQTEDFSLASEEAELRRQPGDIGALVSFTGVARSDDGVVALCLEHYPGATERALADIVDQARRRWPDLGSVTIIHRIGELRAGQNIVLVIASSSHRGTAFAAAEYLMDWLKTEAPFWKKELLSDGSSRWVEARDSDDRARDRWR